MQFVHNQTSSLSPYLYTLNFKCTHTHPLFQDITVVKSMKSPPAGVKLHVVMEAISILKAVKPDHIPDPSWVREEDQGLLGSLQESRLGH